MEPVVALGIVLLRLRKEKGITQERLAQESGHSVKYINQLEQGMKNPSLPIIFRIAEVLGVSPVLIFRLIQEEIAQPPPE